MNNAPIVLATVSRLTDPATAVPLALVALGSALGVLALWSLLRRRGDGHRIALRHLAAGLGVGRRDRRLVYAMARYAGVPTPASLLISRGCFDDAMRRYVAAHGRAARVIAVRDQVFDDEPITREVISDQ